MNNTKYAYAVARIRALEVSLFSDAVIEQLLACRTAEEALRSVMEKGWGDVSGNADMDAVLKREEEKEPERQALERELGHQVLVSPYAQLTGAIGAALLARKQVEREGRAV